MSEAEAAVWEVKVLVSSSVRQQVMHVWLAHTQSRSQSSSLAQKSPRQWPSQVHDNCVGLGRDVDIVCVTREGDRVIVPPKVEEDMEVYVRP